MVANLAMDTKSLSRVEHVERVDYGRKSKGLWLACLRRKCRGMVCVHRRRIRLWEFTVAIMSDTCNPEYRLSEEREGPLGVGCAATPVASRPAVRRNALF